MFEAGQIIDKEQHIMFANWKAMNPCNLYSVPVGDGMYRLEETIISELDISVSIKRAERDLILANTDKYMISDFPICEEERQKMISYRQYLRDVPQSKDFPNIEIKKFEQFEII